MIKVHAYLNFAGRAEEAFKFYKSVFGGEFSSLVRFKDMPMEGVQLSAAAQEQILHIALPIGRDDMLMGSDVPEGLVAPPRPGSTVHISLHPDSKEEADRIFRGLSAGGRIEQAIGDAPWGDYYGSFEDKFGINWMVNYSPPKQ